MIAISQIHYFLGMKTANPLFRSEKLRTLSLSMIRLKRN